MSVNENCEKIIRQVCNSNLDFHMNQTPYSIYFSIRKKFVRGHIPIVPKAAPEEPTFCESKSLETDVFNIWHEYNKLYNIYQVSASEISRLNDELAKKCDIEGTVGELKEANHRLDLENKSLKNESSAIKDKHDKKCKEVKVLKDEINLVKKDKNSTSVALTRCKKEQIETIKSHEQKIKNYEKKLNELVEYRNNKLSEERDIKIKQRKELKKSKKHQSEERNKIEVKDTTISCDSQPEERDFNLNIPVSNFFDSLTSCKSVEVEDLSSILASSASKSSSSSSDLPSPVNTSQPDLSSPVNTSQPVSLCTNNSNTFNQALNKQKQEASEKISEAGWSEIDNQKKEVLAALKMFNSKLDTFKLLVN